MDGNERLAAVEVLVSGVQKDITEIKADVKSLIVSEASRVGVRSFLVTIIPFGALGASIAALIKSLAN